MMAPVVLLIRYKMLLERLEDDELQRYLSLMVTRFGRKAVLTTMVFGDTQCDEEVLLEKIEMVHDIIRKREPVKYKKSSSEEDSQHFGIDSLSVAAIGEISSYLCLEDTIQFGRTSRQMFIGCNSPSNLRVLNLLKITDYSSVDLRQFPKLDQLHIRLLDFADLDLPENASICSNLTTLILDGGHMDPEAGVNVEPTKEAIQVAINAFVSKALPVDKITHLKLKKIPADYRAALPPSLFLQLLSSFPALQNLLLEEVQCSPFDSDTAELLGNALPNLNALSFVELGQDLAPMFWRVFGHKLKAVAHSECDFPDRINFKNLEELEAWILSTEDVQRIFMPSVVNLRRISLRWDDDECGKLVTDLLTGQKHLDQLVIEASLEDVCLRKICTCIEQGVSKVAGGTKDFIRINLYFQSGRRPYANTAAISWYMIKLVEALDSSNIESFEVVCSFSETVMPLLKDWESEMDQFSKNNSSRYQILYRTRDLMIADKAFKAKESPFKSSSSGWLTDPY